MSKVAPHNATIQFLHDGQRPYVLKSYRAKYTALQEAEAYERIGRLTDGKDWIRPATLYRVDEASDSIAMEFVPGKSLWEIVAEAGPAVLDELRSPLVGLLAEARAKRIRFDSDPSNLMYDPVSKHVVVIDPVCVDLDIDDFSMVVFLWGLIKLVVRNHRFWRSPSILAHWRRYYREYLSRTGADFDEINRQMARYIDVTIGWNRERNPIEGRTMMGFRKAVVVPLYALIRSAFRWNLVRP